MRRSSVSLSTPKPFSAAMMLRSTATDRVDRVADEPCSSLNVGISVTFDVPERLTLRDMRRALRDIREPGCGRSCTLVQQRRGGTMKYLNSQPWMLLLMLSAA